MKTAVFSDVHGNLAALKQFVRETELQVDSYLSLGDVVGYGPYNDECIEIVQSLPGIVCVEGNHERMFAGTENLEDQIPLVRAFNQVSIKYFSKWDFVSNLPKSVLMGDYLCTHTIDNRTIYRDTAIELDQNYLIGHSHHQYFEIRNSFNLVNPGSIGQNRGKIEYLEYAVFDHLTGTFEFHSSKYDFEKFLSDLNSFGYPEICLNYLRSKQEN